jgi:putative transposase
MFQCTSSSEAITSKPVFFESADYLNYLDWLREYAIDCHCQVHAYVLMTNHVHLLLTGKYDDSPGRLMKRLGQRYVQYINRTYERSGTLWEGRFRSCLVCEETYLLRCYRYIELNPVRGGIVSDPANYRWSSYRANAQGEPDALVTAHPVYDSLGPSDASRAQCYRLLFENQLKPESIEEIRQATNGNYVLGSTRFRSRVAEALNCRTSRGKPGRPLAKQK